MEVKHVIQMIQRIHDGEMDDVVHHVNQLHSRIHSVIVHITDIHNIQALQRHGWIVEWIYVQYEQWQISQEHEHQDTSHGVVSHDEIQ